MASKERAWWAGRLDGADEALMAAALERHPLEWAAFRAHVIEGRSIGDIAQSSGRSYERIRQRIAKAGRILRHPRHRGAFRPGALEAE